jgi:hypothetical protein
VTQRVLKFLPGLTAGVWVGQWVSSHNWDLATGATIMAVFVLAACLYYDWRAT